MKVLLREATINDLELILAWRSIPEVYKGLYQQAKENRPLTWDEHYSFWHNRHNWRQWIIQVNDNITTRDIGYINLGQLDNWNPEIAIVIGEVTLWGKGIGKQSLILAIDWLKEQGYEKVHTTILKNNERSIRLFESVDFKRTGEGREGEWTYEKNIG